MILLWHCEFYVTLIVLCEKKHPSHNQRITRKFAYFSTEKETFHGEGTVGKGSDANS